MERAPSLADAYKPMLNNEGEPSEGGVGAMGVEHHNGPLVRLPTYFNDYKRRWYQRPSCLWIIIVVQAVLVSFFFCGAIMPFAEAMRDSISKKDVKESRENFHAGEKLTAAFTSFPPDQLHPNTDASEPYIKRYFVDDHAVAAQFSEGAPPGYHVYVSHVLDDAGKVQYEVHMENVVGAAAASLGRYADAFGSVSPRTIRWQVLNKTSGDVFTIAPLDLALGNHSSAPGLFYFSHVKPGQSYEERVLTFVSTLGGKPVAFLGKGSKEWEAVQEFTRAHQAAFERGHEAGRRLYHEASPGFADGMGEGYDLTGSLINHEMMAWCPIKQRYVHYNAPPDGPGRRLMEHSTHGRRLWFDTNNCYSCGSQSGGGFSPEFHGHIF